MSRPVKVRFSPSPTGTPHVGLIRTALYNWAFAKANGGTFLFRIEDTDIARDSEGSFDQLIDALAWLKIDTDEGVIKGGPNGPYRQSERMPIYADVAANLLAEGYLYESYSNKDEIDARNIANGLRPELGYDNFDRNTTEAEKLAFKAAGRLPVLRMRVPEEDITINDLVRGKITFPAGSFSDFVVIRDNGAPLYTFVNPVDDALMGVTHVLRGEDLLSSTPKQIVLWRALIAAGYADEVPEYGHLPYILGEGNKKMAKRDPQSNLFNLRDAGYIPEGLLNYLALLGWAISSDRDIFSMDEMGKAFDVTKVASNPARFDEKKATAINAEHIRLLSDEELFDYLLPVVKNAGLITDDTDVDALKDLIPSLKLRVRLLPDAVDYVAPILNKSFRGTRKAETDEERFNTDFAINLLMSVPNTSFNLQGLETRFVTAVEASETITNKTLWLPVRLALVDSKISLPAFDIMVALGKDETLKRLHAFISQNL
jgi:glutamyl-tRNA synthetase